MALDIKSEVDKIMNHELVVSMTNTFNSITSNELIKTNTIKIFPLMESIFKEQKNQAHRILLFGVLAVRNPKLAFILMKTPPLLPLSPIITLATSIYNTLKESNVTIHINDTDMNIDGFLDFLLDTLKNDKPVFEIINSNVDTIVNSLSDETKENIKNKITEIVTKLDTVNEAIKSRNKTIEHLASAVSGLKSVASFATGLFSKLKGGATDDIYYHKYMKYKHKYLQLKNKH